MTPLEEQIKYIAKNLLVDLDADDIYKISNQVVDLEEYVAVIKIIEEMIFAANKSKGKSWRHGA